MVGFNHFQGVLSKSVLYLIFILWRDKMLKEVLEREIKEQESHLDWLYYLLDTEKFEEPKDPRSIL
jgi:hypothetical protein